MEPGLYAVEETSNSMALDGIMFEGVTVRIRRPADYNAALAAPLGPSMPNPNLNLAAIGMDKAQAAPGAMGGGPVSRLALGSIARLPITSSRLAHTPAHLPSPLPATLPPR